MLQVATHCRRVRHIVGKTQTCREFSTASFDTFRALSQKDATVSNARVCPLRYRYGASSLRDATETTLPRRSVLYAVGGMYGNPYALDAVASRVREENSAAHVHVVFNGDFNFFNSRKDWVFRINETIRDTFEFDAIVGNVELEIADPTSGDGCGCAYPGYVGDGVVDRSNQIVQVLRTTLESDKSKRMSDVIDWLRSLTMFKVFSIGSKRIAVIHGDANALAGWQFALENLPHDDESLAQSIASTSLSQHLRNGYMSTMADIEQCFEAANVDAFLSTHTCLPVGQCFKLGDSKHGVIMNNGAAGMPNLSSTHFGLMTRVSDITNETPADSIIGKEVDGLRYDLIPVHYNHEAWVNEFAQVWPLHSAAHESYNSRIMHGVSNVTAVQINRL